jgi:hypothetical protein
MTIKLGKYNSIADRNSDIVLRRQEGESEQVIAESLGISYASVYLVIKNAGLPPSQPWRLTDEKRQQIINLFLAGAPRNKIKALVKCSDLTISNVAKEAKLDIDRQSKLNRSKSYRKYTLNEHFFDRVDTEEKAYCLGYILGDGNIRRNGYTVTIVTKFTDRIILEAIKDELNYGGPIYHKTSVVRGKRHKGWALSMSSVLMVEALAKLGIGPAKSLTVVPPSGPPELMRHFWRGVVDADGCLSWDGRAWAISIVGSEETIDRFAEYCKTVCGTDAIKYRAPKAKAWTFKVGGNLMAKKMADNLYDKATIFLPRKMILSKEVMSITDPWENVETKQLAIVDRFLAGESPKEIFSSGTSGYKHYPAVCRVIRKAIDSTERRR